MSILYSRSDSDGQIFGQKLQALVIVKIQKKALSELCRPITVGRCELLIQKLLAF